MAPFNYSLNPSFDSQFSENNQTSSETIFDVPHYWAGWGSGNAFYYFGGQELWGGSTTHSGRNMEYGWNDWANVVVSNASVQAFTYPDESGANYTDPRAALTFYGDAASGGDTDFCQNCSASTVDPLPDYAKDENGNKLASGPFRFLFQTNGYRTRKYNNYEVREKEEIPSSNINSQVIRYADVLLMLAEALIEQGKVDEALPLINQVRARVEAFQYGSLGSQDNARTILRRERRLELWGEQSRYFDLIRWGIAKEVINAEKQAPIFQDRHILFPIPQAEKDANPNVATDISSGWN
ncbi:MAG: RagB/SusD family nutrient uptake outer membrane protein [Bacteroidia bacterium]|nr:RagB/SusD family nutrient uptake outer membrane protein [Bacteroidia bacterium]